MAANAQRLRSKPVLYYPYVEPGPGAGKGLLAALAQHACVIVTDDYPGFFLPRMISAAAGQLSVLMEKVDSNGILPLSASDRVFTTAHSFRRYLQKNLREHLTSFPKADPLKGVQLPKLANLPRSIGERWPVASADLLARAASALAALPIDHQVKPACFRGGAGAGSKSVREFVDRRLDRYADLGNHPDEDVRSGLSPYLHFGHVSAHQVVRGV